MSPPQSIRTTAIFECSPWRLELSFHRNPVSVASLCPLVMVYFLPFLRTTVQSQLLVFLASSHVVPNRIQVEHHMCKAQLNLSMFVPLCLLPLEWMCRLELLQKVLTVSWQSVGVFGLTAAVGADDITGDKEIDVDDISVVLDVAAVSDMLLLMSILLLRFSFEMLIIFLFETAIRYKFNMKCLYSKSVYNAKMVFLVFAWKIQFRFQTNENIYISLKICFNQN